MATEQFSIRSKAVYLDPSNCGSSIGYRIYIEEHKYKDEKNTYCLNASVDLADCSHKIEWSFGEDCIDKIDAAIKLLQEFRKELVATEKLYNSLEAKK